MPTNEKGELHKNRDQTGCSRVLKSARIDRQLDLHKNLDRNAGTNRSVPGELHKKQADRERRAYTGAGAFAGFTDALALEMSREGNTGRFEGSFFFISPSISVFSYTFPVFYALSKF